MIVAKKEIEYNHLEKEKEIEKVKHPKRKKKKKSAYRLMFLTFAMLGLILALVILYRYENITKIRLEITDLQRQKINLEKERDDLLAELESIKSSAKIEEDAFTKLGMNYPTDDQIVYIEVTEPDFEKQIEEEEFNFLGLFKNIVNFALSFFKGV